MNAAARRQKRAAHHAAFEYRALAAAVKLALCAIRDESGAARRLHLAGLLAWTPGQTRHGATLRIRFDHGPTAWWVAEVLATPMVTVAELDGDTGVLLIHNPQRVLGPYGYRDGRWLGGQGHDATLGAVRGAVHAAATFDRAGMTIACPTAPMMLNLTGLIRRLGIAAFPTGGQPHTVVAADLVTTALTRLGLDPDVVNAQRLRELARKDRSA